MGLCRGFMACYNTNVDAVIKTSAAKLRGMRLPAELSELPYAAKEQRSEEVLITRSTAEWIEHHFPQMTDRMGGQAGIAASVAAKLGVRAVLVQVAAPVQRQMKLFPDMPVLLAPHYGGSAPVHRHYWLPGQPLIHYVFEYPGGRFIASHDHTNPLIDDEQFEAAARQFVPQADRVFLSGFHLLTGKRADEIDDAVAQIKAWRKANHNLRIHLEMGFYVSPGVLRRVCKKVLPLVDSLGMDETETASFAAACRWEGNMFDIAEAALNRVPKVLFHCPQFAFILARKSYPADKRDLNNSLLLAAHAAGYAAIRHNIPSMLQAMEFTAAPLEAGLEAGTGFLSREWDCVTAFQPAYGVPVVERVGLGDVLAASQFATE